MASWREESTEDIRRLFEATRRGAYLSRNSVPYEPAQGQIQPTGWVENIDPTLGHATVLITSEGIRIRDGKIFIEDYAGSSVLGAAGFEGSWVSYIADGVYNSQFAAGTVDSVQTDVTEVGGADTVAEYEDSMSTIIPYWIISNKQAGGGSPQYQIESDGGPPAERSFRVFSTSGDGTTQGFAIYQDVPVAQDMDYEIEVDWKTIAGGIALTGGNVGIVVKTEWRDGSHASVSPVTTLADLRRADSFTRHKKLLSLVGTPGAAPPDAVYCRVKIECIVTANDTDSREVRIYGVACRQVPRRSQLSVGFESTWPPTVPTQYLTDRHILSAGSLGELDLQPSVANYTLSGVSNNRIVRIFHTGGNAWGFLWHKAYGAHIFNGSKSVGNGTWDTLDGYSTDYDQGGFTITATGGVVEVDRAGKYLVTALASFPASGAGTHRTVGVGVDGATPNAESQISVVPVNNAGVATKVTLSRVFNLTVNQNVRIFVIHDQGSAQTVTNGLLSVTYLGQ